MIGMLQGVITLKDSPIMVIDVHGVGYNVFVSHALFAAHQVGETVKLYTHTYIRDDALELYGFSSPEDLKLFQMLINVSGVGCKSALGIFSIGQRGDIVNAIIKGDVGFFTAVPRLGKKNAQKIIIELKNKLGGVDDLDLSDEVTNEQQEAIAALKNFGFTHHEAQNAIRKITGDGLTTEEIIRLALKELGK
ncbi:MAG: Holliday junction branch migration protein RuvA [Patescibacteria group bacterium]|nr:MAG: Holliday junction branch migration protein RuvA [Patescibacteria group bacterium]